MRNRGHHHGPHSDQARRRMDRIAAIRAMRADGVPNNEMAERLCISPATLRNFVNLYARRAECPAICQAWEAR